MFSTHLVGHPHLHSRSRTRSVLIRCGCATSIYMLHPTWSWILNPNLCKHKVISVQRHLQIRIYVFFFCMPQQLSCQIVTHSLLIAAVHCPPIAVAPSGSHQIILSERSVRRCDNWEWNERPLRRRLRDIHVHLMIVSRRMTTTQLPFLFHSENWTLSRHG